MTRPPRHWLVQEVWLVVALTLGASAVWSLLSLVVALVREGSLSAQTAALNSSRVPGHPWLDLLLQLTGIALNLVPVLLVAHLLQRSGESLPRLLLGRAGRRDLRRDAVRGAVLAAAVGGSGLALYLTMHALGASLTVVPESLPDAWWKLPVLVLAAAQNALLEEVLVVGYLLSRLRRFGWSDRTALVASAVLRGGYHLYQGFGGFLGNLVMGLLFGWLFQRWGRVGPLVLAHTLIDVVAFVGYDLLAGHVDWLPVPGG